MPQTTNNNTPSTSNNETPEVFGNWTDRVKANVQSDQRKQPWKDSVGELVDNSMEKAAAENVTNATFCEIKSLAA